MPIYSSLGLIEPSYMKILRQTTDLCFCIYIVRVTYLVQDMYTIRDCEVYLQIDVARFADL